MIRGVTFQTVCIRTLLTDISNLYIPRSTLLTTISVDAPLAALHAGLTGGTILPVPILTSQACVKISGRACLASLSALENSVEDLHQPSFIILA
jgi:hypothetical protein